MSQDQDPLFEALVKYVTARPDSNPPDFSGLADLINQHTNVPGGRDFLSEVAAPANSVPTPAVMPGRDQWTAHTGVQGSISTGRVNGDAAFSLKFRSSRNVPSFSGKSDGGDFLEQEFEFSDGTLYYDVPMELGQVRFQASIDPASNVLHVEFSYVSGGPSIAHLSVKTYGFILPHDGFRGEGLVG